MSDNQTSRLYGLDLLRISLALLVFLFHTAVHFNCQYGFLRGVIQYGAFAMSGFFMLSGYSLYYVYHGFDFSKIGNLGLFYKRRFFGLFPVYYFAAILFIIFFAKETVKQQLLLAPIEALGLQSVFDSLFGYSHNGGTWFISCIVICYLVFPLMQIICKQISNRLRMIFIALCTAVLFLSPVIVKIFGLSGLYSNPFFRCLEFFIGVNIASFCKKDIKSHTHIYRALANKLIIVIESVWIILFVSFYYMLGIGTGSYMFLSIGTLIPFAMMIFGLANTEFGKVVANKVTLYLSSVSYCFFLSQLFMPELGKLVFKYISCPNLVKIVILFLICTVISITMHELVEKPIRRLLKSLNNKKMVI